MKALIGNLSIDDSPKDSPESSGSVPDSIVDSSGGGHTNPDMEMGHDSSWYNHGTSDEYQVVPNHNMQMMIDELGGWEFASDHHEEQSQHKQQGSWQGYR